jgi:hypothetical protein
MVNDDKIRWTTYPEEEELPVEVDEVSTSGVPQGPGSMTGAFTMSMFKNQNWVKHLERLLVMIEYQGQGQQSKKVEVGKEITNAAVNSAAQMAIDIMDSILSNTEFSQVLETEKWKESTRLSSGEMQRPQPPKGEPGRGMIPKRVEAALSPITNALDVIFEDLIMLIHESIDERLGSQYRDTKVPDVSELDTSEGIPESMKTKYWTNTKRVMYYSIKETIDDIQQILSRELKQDKGDLEFDMKNTLDIIMDKSSVRDFATNVFFILSYKLRQGMAGRSESYVERGMNDILTPKEIKWIEDNIQEGTINVPPEMGGGQMRVVSGPEFEETDTGIMTPRQVDASTGEEYHLPRDIGEVDKPDFNPEDEEFEENEYGPSESNAPEVKDYKRGKGMRKVPEWQQFQDKNAMDAINTNSFKRAWDTLKKK